MYTYIYITGWWFQPLWKILISWDDDIPNIYGINKSHFPIFSKPPTSTYSYKWWKPRGCGLHPCSSRNIILCCIVGYHVIAEQGLPVLLNQSFEKSVVDTFRVLFPKMFHGDQKGQSNLTYHLVTTNSLQWKITMLLSSVNHLFLWAIYTMAMLVIARG